MASAGDPPLPAYHVRNAARSVGEGRKCLHHFHRCWALTICPTDRVSQLPRFAASPPLPPPPRPSQERQRLQRCLQHTLNNLLQMPAASAADLDDLANQLAPGRALQPLFHPHRTVWLGNWDVNVLELALRRHGKELQVGIEQLFSCSSGCAPCRATCCSLPSERGEPLGRH